MKVICPHCLSINNVPYKQSYKKANCGKCKRSLLETKPIEASASDFDKILANSDIPVIVDFWAPWCGPCKMMAPVFEKTAAHFPLKAAFVKVNTENEQNLAARFGIRGIPTLAVFKNAKEVERTSGAMDENGLKSFVQRFV